MKRPYCSLLTVLFVSAGAVSAHADTDLNTGNQTTTQTLTPGGSYDIPNGTTLNYTGTSEAVTVASNATTTTIDANGSIIANPPSDTSHPYAIYLNGTNGNTTYDVNVGSSSVLQSTDIDTIRVKGGGTLNLNNQGQIISLESDPDDSGISSYTGDAIDMSKSTGPKNATDYTSGGIITNGSTTNSAALIKDSTYWGIDMGSNSTINNYGSIIDNNPVNDNGKNEALIPGAATGQQYQIGRAVEFDSANYSVVNNYAGGLIDGSGAGVDATNPGVGLVVNNSGTIIGENGSGIGADTESNFTVTNTATGKIYGKSAGAGNIIDNTGQATPDADPDGIDIDGIATIYNSGLVETTSKGSGYDARGRANTADGLSIGGGRVFNYKGGQIISAQNGVTVNDDAAPERTGSAALALENDGLIQANAGYAIRSENNPGDGNTPPGSNDDDVVVNTGTIIGGTATPNPSQVLALQGGVGGADTYAFGTLDGVTYTAGTNNYFPGSTNISGFNPPTYTDSTGTHVGNAGLVEGDGSVIQMGQGDDVLTNTGTITALNGAQAINMEDGDDTVNIEQGSQITGDMDGGNGSEVNGDTLNLDTADHLGLKDLNGNTITSTPGGSTTFTYAGGIHNFEHVNVVSGKTILTGNSDYAGVTTIGGQGTPAALEMDGTHTGAGNYHVAAGGTLSGSGSLTMASASNTLTVDQGGTFAPGTETGGRTFSINQGSVDINGTMAFTLDGTIAGAHHGFDQAAVTFLDTGSFTLGATATLDVSFAAGYTPKLGDMFYLVEFSDYYQTTPYVTGTFAGLADGADFAVQGQEFQISYEGPDGNELTITDIGVAPEPSTVALMMIGAGGLVFLARRKSAFQV